jgi:hypothetical protein
MVRVVASQRVYKGGWGGYSSPYSTATCVLMYLATVLVWMVQIYMLAGAVVTFSAVLPLPPYITGDKTRVAIAVGSMYDESVFDKQVVDGATIQMNLLNEEEEERLDSAEPGVSFRAREEMDM